jgi:hypothetical protein
MTGRKRVLILERLNFGSLLYILFTWRRWQQVHYLSEEPLGKWRWIGSVIREWFIAKAKTHRLLLYEPSPLADVVHKVSIRMNDSLYDDLKPGNHLIQFLRSFKDDSLVEVAVRRALLVEYTFERIKCYALLANFVDARKPESPITFLPRDNLDFLRYLDDPIFGVLNNSYASYRIPPFIRFANRFGELARYLSWSLRTSRFIVGLVLHTGLTRRIPERKSYAIGYDVFPTGIHWENTHYEQWIYDDADFHPGRILHVIRGRLTDVRTREYLEENGYPYAEWGTNKIPIRYFLKRVLFQFYFLLLINGLKQLVAARNRPLSFLIAPTVHVIASVIRNEVFYNQYYVKVFIARDEGDYQGIIRTMILNERGGKTIGFMHGAFIRHYSISYITMDYYCVFGEFDKQWLQNELRYSRNVEVIGIGIYGLDESFKYLQQKYVPEKYQVISTHYKVIIMFGSDFELSDAYTRQHALRYWRLALSLLKQYDDVYLIIKPKGEGREFADPELAALIKKEGGERLQLERDLWTYELISTADLMICPYTSTVGLEGLVAGRRVLYFDLGHCVDHPFRKYDRRLVADNEEELLSNVRWALEGEYLEPHVWNFIRTYHGCKFDGQVIKRFKEVVLKALHEVDSHTEEGITLSHENPRQKQDCSSS